MARGVKRLTPQEQLDKLTTQIAECEAKIEELTAQKKEIEKQLDEKRQKELIDMINASGKSDEEIKAFFAGQAE